MCGGSAVPQMRWQEAVGWNYVVCGEAIKRAVQQTTEEYNYKSCTQWRCSSEIFLLTFSSHLRYGAACIWATTREALSWYITSIFLNGYFSPPTGADLSDICFGYYDFIWFLSETQNDTLIPNSDYFFIIGRGSLLEKHYLTFPHHGSCITMSNVIFVIRKAT